MELETVNASASPEAQINQNFSALGHQSCYAMKAPTTSGLTWGYWGGRWSGYSVASGTLTLTNTTTNYITVNRSSGAISTSVLSDNWDDIVNHARVYKVTTAGGIPSAIEDHRAGLNGVHGYMAGGSIGGGGGGGSVKLYPDATELLAESAVTIGVREMNDSAAETTPTTITGTANNNTVQIGPAFENGAVNATELAGGEWTLDLYASVDNTAGDTRAKISQYLKQAQAGTITITGTGTSRTATVTGGTPFVVGDYDAADVSKCAWIRTPTAYLRVSGYTSSSVVTVECKTGYVNDSAVAYSKDKYIAQGTSAEINDTSTGYQVVEWFFNTVACSTTDVVMIRFWASTTATANRTATINYGGTTNYTHVHTTLPFQHNDLAGLNAGDLLHLTAAEKEMMFKAPLGANYNGIPTASFVVMRHPVAIPFTIPAGMTGSVVKSDVAATAQTDFDCLKNGVSFGTIRFAAAGTTATFIAASPTSFVSGDVLKIVAPATPDATLADIGFTLLTTKVA